MQQCVVIDHDSSTEGVIVHSCTEPRSLKDGAFNISLN